MRDYYLDPPEFTEPNNASVLLTLKNNIEARAMRQRDSLTDRIGGELYDSLS